MGRLGCCDQLVCRDFPAAVFAELYHQRWRIEEAFKRLKHRSKLESVSGLTQHALLVDVYAKVLADNLASLVCQGAAQDADFPSRARTCNRAYAAPCLQRLLPRMALGLGCIAALLENAFSLLGGNSHRLRARSKSAASNIPCETASKLGIQGVMP